jgi:hypothetical protein
MSKLAQMTSVDIVYNVAGKDAFHRAAKKALKAVAEKLGLSKSDYDLRNNKAGPAVTGEVTLHTDKLYVQVSGGMFSDKLSVMYRTCNGRKDYTGGTNNFTSVEVMESDSFIDKLKAMAK